MSEEEERLQPVTFGSVIYLSTESSLDSFMFCDGFMENRVTIKSFNGICGEGKGHHDFSFCLFMVLPFTNVSCFDYQRKMVNEWREKLLDNSSSHKLEERKNIVSELKNKLESELQFNIGTLQKSKKNNICFGTSNFMLLHVNSLKFLCLFQDDNNNLFLELVSNPDPNCFFDFDPSLKLQRGRSDNFVYEDEIVYLTCTEKFSGKSPFICVQQQDLSGYGLKKDEKLIIGAIDEKENWKVNIYEEPLEETSNQFMRVGCCVWILLSEKLLFLTAARELDPFQELYEFQHGKAGEQFNALMKQKGKQKNKAPLSRLETLHSNKSDLTEGFLSEPWLHMYDEMRLKVELNEIKEPSDKVGESEELPSFGLWKVEGLNVKKGGELRWDDKYRLKHLLTGMYLTIIAIEKPEQVLVQEGQSTKEYSIKLTTAKDEKTEFQFVSIDNLILYENKPQNKGFIQKDAFFMIQNCVSGQWVGFYERSETSEGEEKSSIRSPVLYNYIKDVNTFRFREANPQCIWENYSLISSFPVLFEITRNKIDTCKMVLEAVFRKETLDKKAQFDRFYSKTIFILEFFVDFLLNKILSNINLDQEIMYPSDIRQTKFQQQYLLGLICWMIIQIFPTFEEFEKLQISPEQESIGILINQQLLKAIQTTIKKRKGVKQTSNYLILFILTENITYNFKVCQEHLLKKYNIAKYAYNVLYAACYQNVDNQDFVFKFIRKLSDHFGYGEFVTEAFQIIFKDNFRILHQIHREQFQIVNDQGVPQSQTQDIFEVITGRLKLYEPYRKIEILNLLGAFTHIGKNSIYINQEKVFTSIVENKNFLFGHLPKLICEREDAISIEYRVFVEKEYESRIVEFIDFTRYFEQKDQVMLDYFKAQLKLYALLCQNRNYACVKNMQELLPQKILLSYLSQDKINDDIRAIICLMLLNLYVDKEPRTIINKPNFVRVFKAPPPTQDNFLGNMLPFHHHHHHHHRQQNKVGAMQLLDGDQKQGDKKEKDDITARFIEINLSDDITGAYEIRDWLLNYLEGRTQQVIAVQDGRETSDITNYVFCQLTFEVIRTLNMMVKFGLFTKYATRLMEMAQLEKQKVQNPDFKESQFDQIDHLEKLVNLLAVLLEFDYSYVRELYKHDFKRSYINLQKEEERGLLGFGGGLLTGGLGVGGLFGEEKKADSQEDEEKVLQQKHEQNDEQQNYHFLKRYQSMLRIIQKFTNKTYTNKEFKIEVKDDYQVLIKREICSIFENLLQWREDFFIENVIQFFQESFYNNYINEGDIIKQTCDTEQLAGLMPDLFVDPGVAIKDKKFTFKQICTNEEVRDLDLILKRPFIEVIIITFYFSTDPDLQNVLANLIYKIYNQREKVLSNIKKISLVDADSGDQSYTKLSQLMNKLKGLISYSQSWLQIIEQNIYDEKAEQILIKTQKKLQKMLDVFQEKSPDNSEAFVVKQKVFKHLGGHRLILKFIEQGTTVIDSKIDYFKEKKEEAEYSYKNSFIKNVRNTFMLSHQILSTFVEQNPPNQASIYKHYGKMLINLININIGQEGLIKDIFNNNLHQCKKPPGLYFNFMVGLIRDHGQYAQFLDLFLVFLKVAKQLPDNQDMQKAILSTLFSDEFCQYVNPFMKIEAQDNKNLPQYYPDPINQQLYIDSFIRVINETLQVDVGINFIVKVNFKLEVTTLLNLLYEICKNESKWKQKVNESGIFILKSNICDIIQIFLSKLDVALVQYKNGADSLTQILDFYIVKLANKKNRLTSQDVLFIINSLVCLVNNYFEHFLKDIGMIALKMLSNDENVQKEKKVFHFASVITDNLDQFFIVINQPDFPFYHQGPLLTNMAKLAKNFNILIPEKFTQLKTQIDNDSYHLQQQHTEENEIDELFLTIQKINKPKANSKLSLIKKKMHVVKDIVAISKILPKEVIQHSHQTSPFSKCWQAFVQMFTTSKFVKGSLREERERFPNVITVVQSMFEGKDDIREREILISKDDIITKLLRYIQYWKAKKANRNTIIFILNSIRTLMQIGDNEQDLKKRDLIRQKKQIHLDSLNATQIALKLYWKDKQTQDPYIYQLIKFIIALLDGENKTIQMSILQLFKTNSDSEAFFRKIFNVLNDEMNSIKVSLKSVQTKQSSHDQRVKRRFIEKTLRVIQLLCEGHNNQLQDYLRSQTNSKVSYDIVSLMVKLVIAHKISNKTYKSVVQCLETLTEVVQGPCKENQMVIVTSKFLEWSIDLLREEEKIFDLIVDIKGKHHEKHLEEGEADSPRKINSGEELSHKLLEQSEAFGEKLLEPEAQIERAHNRQGAKRLDIHRGLLMRLKLKCTVTLLSLLELQENNEEIVNRLIRSIPCSILVNELANLFKIHKSIYKDDYVIEAFKRHESKLEGTEPESQEHELIIEYGFNLFILANILIMKNKKPQETELEDIQQIIEDFQYQKEKTEEGFLDAFDLLGDLSKLGSSMLSGALDGLKNLAGVDQAALSELQHQRERKQLQKDAFEFFCSKTAFIEIVRDDELQKIYFPLLPQCKILPKECKKEFHENVDHSSIRDKLVQLMHEADDMIQVMEHEENLRKLFKTSKLLEIIASHKALWENLAFIANIVVNLTIIASYSQYVYTDSLGENDDQDKLQNARLYEPRFWFKQSFTWTRTMIQIMGAVTLGFSSLVVLFFCLKKAPLLIKDMWIEFFKIQCGFCKKSLLFVKTVAKSFIACCTDYDFVYYMLYMACLVLGLVVHPFVFIFLLVDFLKIQTLKIVVKAIWISKGPMGLTFLVFLLVEYYFAIISYMYFWDQFVTDDPNVYPCQQMWYCFLTILDQTFKNGGGIGDYVQNQLLLDEKGDTLPINSERSPEQQISFIFNNMYSILFKFMLVIILITMVGGIIIDNFKSLKDQMLESERNLTEFCFICGIEKEKLDKSTQHGYISHIKKDHYLWDYVYYKAYLQFKSKGDFSGNETYIKRQLSQNDIDWFPIKRALGYVAADDEGEEDDTAKLALLEDININMPELENQANKVVQKVKNLFEKS